MATLTTTGLKREVTQVLRKQGYTVRRNGLFSLKKDELEQRRKLHELAKAERAVSREDFLLDNIELIKTHLIDGSKLEIDKIDPEIIEVQPESNEEKLFRWWNIIWWSLPYERAYGRQMRFVVWDKYHKAPIGLIGLQSPILSWAPRDKYLGIEPDVRDYWVNQSLSAQRIGALPPYNDVLGGKLVSLLMTADVVRDTFQRKYADQKTVIKQRLIPSNLLFITTTGAYGKSSVYNRLKFNNETVAKFIGYTQGTGTFHIPNSLYQDLVKYLEKKGINVKRGYGSGPSRKLRLIDQALQSLGFANGITHGVKRALYLFPLVNNLKEVITDNEEPVWTHRDIREMTDFWRSKWAHPRATKDESYLEFSGDAFIEQTYKDLEKYKQLCPGA
jgi:hypothetical protein